MTFSSENVRAGLSLGEPTSQIGNLALPIGVDEILFFPSAYNPNIRQQVGF
jgi:hypothetical protein